MTPSEPTSPELLLAHAGWMRALALGLVHDPHEADDVAQDAALAALLHPPPTGAALRPWLATVVRNFAWRRRRAAARRSEHEDFARKPDSGDDNVATLERIDLQRKLLDAVRELPEPLCTTIVQRYFEGRTSAGIARSSGVPSATVRARLKRGLEALRGRLDSEAGSRGAWMALIVPLVPRDFAPTAAGAGTVSASLATQGVLTMTVVKIVLSSAAAAVAALALWDLARPEPAHEPAHEPLAAARVEAATVIEPVDESTIEAPRAPLRSVAEPIEATEIAPTLEPEESPAIPAPAVGTLEVRFIDAQGTPWAGVELTVIQGSVRRGMLTEVGRVTSDLDGFVRLTVEVPRFRREPGEPAAHEFQLVARGVGCVSYRTSLVVSEGEVANLGEVVLREGATLRGRVVDEGGSALADARVGAVSAEIFDALTPAELDAVARVGSEAFDHLLAISSRVDGSFDLAGLPLDRLRLWAHSPGLRFGLSEVLEADGQGAFDDVELLLADFIEQDLIRGRVVGPDGRGRRAELERDARVGGLRSIDFFATDDDGAFEFAVEHLDAVYELTAHDSLREFGLAQVSDVLPGDVDVVITFGAGQPLRIHLRDEDGEPVPDARFWFSASGSSYTAPARPDGAGDYIVERPGTSFRIEATAPGFRRNDAGPFDPATLSGELDLVLERALELHGLVLADGAPVVGAQVTVHRYDSHATMTVNGRRCLISPFGNGKTQTDSQGRFELAADLAGPFVVRASHPDWADAEIGPLEPAHAEEALELLLSRGGVIEGLVHVPQGESPGGRVVAVHRADGRARSVRTDDDGYFRFEGLLPGGWHVYTLEQDIPPHGGSYASYNGVEPIVWDCQVEIGRTTHHDLLLDEE